ncbi:MAG: toxin-activating lysine-acyltransferase [Burkholderiales bacterium]|nr:toxin-activating lysine-acyltransferase [Burkholderiales bacterium]
MNPSVPRLPASSESSRLKAVRPRDRHAALGMAVSLLAADPAFQRLTFGHWSRTLIGLVRREHFLFVVDGNAVVGFVGWALTTADKAEQWLAGRLELSFDDCLDGEMLVINVWKASTQASNRLLVDALRTMFRTKTAVYYKRFYPDGRVRPKRLKVNAFVESHVRRRPSPATAAVSPQYG